MREAGTLIYDLEQRIPDPEAVRRAELRTHAEGFKAGMAAAGGTPDPDQEAPAPSSYPRLDATPEDAGANVKSDVSAPKRGSGAARS